MYCTPVHIIRVLTLAYPYMSTIRGFPSFQKILDGISISYFSLGCTMKAKLQRVEESDQKYLEEHAAKKKRKKNKH